MLRADWLVRPVRMLGIVAIFAVSVPSIGFSEEPLRQLPLDVASFSLAWVALPQTMAEVTKQRGLLAGASWGVMKGSFDVLERVVDFIGKEVSYDNRTPVLSDKKKSTSGGKNSSLAWLNTGNKSSRFTRHEAPLLRYTF